MASPQAQYLQWKRTQEDVACLFARMLATGKPTHGQYTVTIQAGTAVGLARGIDRKISALIADHQASAAALIFPAIKSLEELARGMLALRSYPHWAVTTSMVGTPPGGDVVAVAVTRGIPAATGIMLPSEALVFGPFDEFPRTRKAPFAALEIYVGIPMEFDPKDGQTPAIKVNLAHIGIPSLSPAQHDRLKRMSGVRRLTSLGGLNDLRAKARVSFIIPLQLAKTLGCAP